MEFILTKQFHVQKWWSFFLCFTNHCIALAIQKGFPVPLKPGHISVVCEAPQYSLLPGPFLKHKQIHYILTTFFLTFSMLGIGLKIFDLFHAGHWPQDFWSHFFGFYRKVTKNLEISTFLYDSWAIVSRQEDREKYIDLLGQNLAPFPLSECHAFGMVAVVQAEWEAEEEGQERDRSWKEEEGRVPALGCHMDQGLSTLANPGLMDPVRLGNTHMFF